MSAIQELMVSKEDDDAHEDALEGRLRKALSDIVLLNDTKEQLTQVSTCYFDQFFKSYILAKSVYSWKLYIITVIVCYILLLL